ncbi:MAG: Mov34/MPN/PAD-1 family protein [Planctomycetes bacterium]|nr:Mov34/MPN/PAD-1 family protein [Planctomycetota bacterium]
MLGWLRNIKSWWQGCCSAKQLAANTSPTSAHSLERIILTDGVARTLFEDFADHRRSERGDEEIGWVLLGMRGEGKTIAVGALPAGINRDAGAAHVLFDAAPQELAIRVLRQNEKRLQIIGVVHTHPGSLRCPSDGDLHGDRAWVGQLRGGEGIFGIGTADARPGEAASANVQLFSDMCFSWYALAAGESRYRTLPVQVAIGPDLALPLSAVWDAIEEHAVPLNRLCRQLAHVQLDVIDESPESMLCVKIALAEPNQQLRVLLNDRAARYYWDRNGALIAIDPREPHLERAVHLILAELAKEFAGNAKEASTLVSS